MNTWSKILNSKVIGFIVGIVCAFLFGISHIASEEEAKKLAK
ncbi:hypothetical protein [Xenorhabdus littoralis]|nr:hypothetical protein [Xenorhabdus sp. Reich]